MPESCHCLWEVGEPVVNVPIEMMRHTRGVYDDALRRPVPSPRHKSRDSHDKGKSREINGGTIAWCPAAAKKARRE